MKSGRVLCALTGGFCSLVRRISPFYRKRLARADHLRLDELEERLPGFQIEKLVAFWKKLARSVAGCEFEGKSFSAGGNVVLCVAKRPLKKAGGVRSWLKKCRWRGGPDVNWNWEILFFSESVATDRCGDTSNALPRSTCCTCAIRIDRFWLLEQDVGENVIRVYTLHLSRSLWSETNHWGSTSTRQEKRADRKRERLMILTWHTCTWYCEIW